MIFKEISGCRKGLSGFLSRELVTVPETLNQVPRTHTVHPKRGQSRISPDAAQPPLSQNQLGVCDSNPDQSCSGYPRSPPEWKINS